MKLQYVDSLPSARRGKHDVQNLIKEFVDSDAKIAKVDFNEHDYKSPSVCRNCIAVSVKRSRRPVKVHQRGNDVYLTKI